MVFPNINYVIAAKVLPLFDVKHPLFWTFIVLGTLLAYYPKLKKKTANNDDDDQFFYLKWFVIAFSIYITPALTLIVERKLEVDFLTTPLYSLGVVDNMHTIYYPFFLLKDLLSA